MQLNTKTLMEQLAEIAKDTETDEDLKRVITQMVRPKDKKQLPESIRHYWKLKDNISVD